MLGFAASYQSRAASATLEELRRKTLTAKPTCSGHTKGSTSVPSKRGMPCSCGEGVINTIQTYVSRLKTIHGLNQYHGGTAHRTVLLAAGGVEIISERPFRY